MCRNIRPLFNFDPPATDEEVRAASLQFVRKLAGFTKPSQANAEAFDRAVEDIAAVARTLGPAFRGRASSLIHRLHRFHRLKSAAGGPGSMEPEASHARLDLLVSNM